MSSGQIGSVNFQRLCEVKGGEGELEEWLTECIVGVGEKRRGGGVGSIEDVNCGCG